MPTRRGIVALRRSRIIASRCRSLPTTCRCRRRVQIAAAEAPHAAEFAGALVIIFAGVGAPGSDARFASPHLGDYTASQCLIGRVVGVDPIPAVRAHVHEAAAALHVIMQRIELRPAVVLGMRSGNDDVVVFKAGETVIADVLVGDDVVLVSHLLQPIDQCKSAGYCHGACARK